MVSVTVVSVVVIEESNVVDSVAALSEQETIAAITVITIANEKNFLNITILLVY
jgi:hypothetical protein